MTPATPHKILLLADDDADDRELFCEALNGVRPDAVSHCVENGQEALDKLQELPGLPHTIFLDINMPVMNGWECLRRLKESEAYRQIPVVIYSTSSLQSDIDRAREEGAFCFFTKPTDFNELKQILALLVTHAGDELTNALKNTARSNPNAVVTCLDKETE